ncbi:MAG: hypothetical protein H8F28_22765 [Fibrella sp.]|nr:hypothetical protein [Armatimonadota bacterium]
MFSFVSPASPFLFAATVGDQPVPVCLFEAGEYPDVGVTVTPDDLDQVVARFQASQESVRVNTEHRNGPLDPLGEVVALFHKGGKLYGAIVFSAGIHQHIKARDAGKFSVGFAAHDEGGFVLDHVAVTATPRVAGTGFLNPVQVAETLAKFSAAGKLTPAMMEPASRLLSAPGRENSAFASLQFSDGSTGSVSADVLALLESMPVVQPRGAAIPGAAFSRNVDAVTPQIKEMAERYGVDAKRLAANVAASRK